MGTSKIYKDEEGNEFLYCGRTKNASWSELEESQADSNKKCQQKQEAGVMRTLVSTDVKTRSVNDLWEMKKKGSESERPKGQTAAKEKLFMPGTYGNENNEMAGMTACITSCKLSLKDLSNDDTLWVGDTGASQHMAKTKKRFVNVQRANSADSFMLGNDACMQAAIVGTLMGYMGRTRIKVTDVSYCPQAKFNLFCLSLMLKRG